MSLDRIKRCPKDPSQWCFVGPGDGGPWSIITASAHLQILLMVKDSLHPLVLWRRATGLYSSPKFSPRNRYSPVLMLHMWFQIFRTVAFWVTLLSSSFLPSNNHKVNKLLILPEGHPPTWEILDIFHGNDLQEAPCPQGFRETLCTSLCISWAR